MGRSRNEGWETRIKTSPRALRPRGLDHGATPILTEGAVMFWGAGTHEGAVVLGLAPEAGERSRLQRYWTQRVWTSM